MYKALKTGHGTWKKQVLLLLILVNKTETQMLNPVFKFKATQLQIELETEPCFPAAAWMLLLLDHAEIEPLYILYYAMHATLDVFIYFILMVQATVRQSQQTLLNWAHHSIFSIAVWARYSISPPDEKTDLEKARNLFKAKCGGTGLSS